MTAEKVRVRFAPSPTGKLHIGGARTAIFNWAFARAMGGSFILRIEDTDPERSTEENVQIILNGMKWLGLDWDEGPEVGGGAGPYFQMQRMDTYTAALDTLKAAGAAYPCFCTKEELDAKRAEAEATEGGYAGYDRTCRTLDAAEVGRRLEAGEPHVWRLKVPENHGPVEFDDAVYGPMSFPIDVMDDMILVRSDGSPTYNFAVVCDDVNMAITHVIRGDDHLSNTPRQILIYEALSAQVPVFAHLPMILGSDGRKLSKRHGATSVEEYRDKGFLPDAMVNFLALLGWSLDGETTIIPRAQLCRDFSLERVTRKDSVFDEAKLDWMNGVYIRDLCCETWVNLSKPWLAAAMEDGAETATSGIISVQDNAEHYAALQEGLTAEKLNALGAQFDALTAECAVGPDGAALTFETLYPLVSERLARLDEIPSKLGYFFWGEGCLLDQKSVDKVLKKEGGEAHKALQACLGVLKDAANPWEGALLEEKCRNLAEPLEMKLKNLLQPLRVAVCGNMVSPPLFESIELLDREAVIKRIENVMKAVF